VDATIACSLAVSSGKSPLLRAPALGLPALKPRAAEMRDRHMRHGGEHLDAGTSAPRKPKRCATVSSWILFSDAAEMLTARTEWVGRGGGLRLSFGPPHHIRP
jgi:hypothetical protein